jgi:hypothetical protein
MPESEEIVASPPTPILDSGVLPSRIRRKTLRGMVTGFMVGLIPGFLLIAMGGQPSEHLDLGLGLLSFFAVLILAVAVHELAHLLAGWAVGFRFNSIQIGPLSLRIEHGLLKAHLRREMTALGYAGMHVNRLLRLRRRLLIYLAAGSAANLLCVPATVLLINNAFPQLGTTWVVTSATQFVILSLILGVLSLIPLSSVAHSDGARIAMLIRSRDRARRWLSILALAHVHNQGIRAKLWKGSWLRAATSLNDMSLDTFVGHLLAYLSANDRKDAPVAAGHLEKCLNMAGIVPISKRDFLAQEAAVFTAWFRNDASLADKWLAQLQKPHLLSRLVQLRVRIATSCARRDFDGAMAGWQEGRMFIDRATAGTARKLMTESWLEWQTEILERQDRPAAMEGSAEQPRSVTA